MSWSGGVLAKFVFNSNTFTPTYPPKGKVPIDGQHAEIAASTTTSGLRQTVLSRIDRVLTLEFPFIPDSDLSDWDAFIGWILAAGQFQYYPDASLTNNNVYQVVDTDLAPEFVCVGHYKLTMNLRRVVTAQIGS